MIRVLDCNALIYLESQRRRVRARHECVVPDEVKDEYLTNPASETWYKACELLSKRLSEADFLTEYARLLNIYPGVSFFNLKGFGDVAILATVSLLIRELPPANTLSPDLFPPETIGLVSNDRRLTIFALREFVGRVSVETPQAFAAKI